MWKAMCSLILTGAFSFTALHAVDSLSTVREQTLSIIKPDAVAGHHIGEIIATFEKNGLHIDAIEMKQLTKQQAEEFYAAHKERPFYKGLVDFMVSGPVVVMVLDGENAVAKNRELMGTTDPKQAAQGSIRANFAKSIGENAVHGSDSKEAAKAEIQFFFKPGQVFNH